MAKSPVDLPNVQDDEIISKHAPWLLELTRTDRARNVMAHVRILVPQVSGERDLLVSGGLSEEEQTRIVDEFERRTGRRQGEVTEMGLPDAFPAIGQVLLGCYLTFGAELPAWAEMAKRYRRLPDTVHVLQELERNADVAKRFMELFPVFGISHAGLNAEFAADALKRTNDRLYGGNQKRRTGLRSLALCLFSSIICRAVMPEFTGDSKHPSNKAILSAWDKAIVSLVLATEEEMRMDYELPETTLREMSIHVRDLMLVVFERAKPFVVMPKKM